MSESDAREEAGVLRSEEELSVSTEPVSRGSVRVRKRVDVQRFDELYERDVEQVGDVERVVAEEGDSGEVETLPDGSISIPVFEERLVVTKQVVVRERVIVRKQTVTKSKRIEADLRRERVEVEGDVAEDNVAEGD